VKYGYKNIYRFINHTSEKAMDMTLAKTVQGFSDYCNENSPNLIVVHGDRVEALAGAIVGSLNNILVSHIEGGEVSGTIDELIRHSVSKLSHIHFVSNSAAKKRLIQMGEIEENIFEIGSPDVDVMMAENLPDLEKAKDRYDIKFDKYAIAMYHPVTTEFDNLEKDVNEYVDALIESQKNYVVIFPNNDLGSSIIIKAYKRLRNLKNFKVFPSLRFEYFLILLKKSKFIVGNSSAGIREAPYYGIPTINIGSRQNNRAESEEILNCNSTKREILDSIYKADNLQFKPKEIFGKGNSNRLFLRTLQKQDFWSISKQKQFKDYNNA
jgi:UDP-N-acetylglucosamine 2-epimerase (hydrolysing)